MFTAFVVVTVVAVAVLVLLAGLMTVRSAVLDVREDISEIRDLLLGYDDGGDGEQVPSQVAEKKLKAVA